MEFKELVKTRRSIRGFQEKDLPDELILELIDGARFAPSGGNCQPWHFYVIKDKAVIAKIHEKAYRGSWILTAPVLIVVCAEIFRSEQRYRERGRDLYCIQDTAAAVQNILLGAKNVGLGGCWVGAFDEKACSEILDLGKGVRPVAILPVGYPVSEPDAPQRRPVEEIVTFI